MDSIIKESCYDMLKALYTGETREQTFNRCVQERLMSIYESENSEYDSLLKKLEMNIDYGQYAQVKVCVTKLLRILGNDRKKLIDTIERLGD